MEKFEYIFFSKLCETQHTDLCICLTLTRPSCGKAAVYITLCLILNPWLPGTTCECTQCDHEWRSVVFGLSYISVQTLLHNCAELWTDGAAVLTMSYSDGSLLKTLQLRVSFRCVHMHGGPCVASPGMKLQNHAKSEKGEDVGHWILLGWPNEVGFPLHVALCSAQPCCLPLGGLVCCFFSGLCYKLQRNFQADSFPRNLCPSCCVSFLCSLNTFKELPAWRDERLATLLFRLFTAPLRHDWLRVRSNHEEKKIATRFIWSWEVWVQVL